MDKIRKKLSFPQKSSEIWYTSHVRVFQNSQMDKIRTKLSFLPKSPEIWYNIHVFGEILQNSQKKIKVPIVLVGDHPMGTLIFLVNSMALHQKHLCIFIDLFSIFSSIIIMTYRIIILEIIFLLIIKNYRFYSIRALQRIYVWDKSQFGVRW